MYWTVRATPPTRRNGDVMTFAASAVAELTSLFGAEAVRGLGQGDGNRLHAVLGLLTWVVVLIDRGEPDAVVAQAVRALVEEVHAVRAASGADVCARKESKAA